MSNTEKKPWNNEQNQYKNGGKRLRSTTFTFKKSYKSYNFIWTNKVKSSIAIAIFEKEAI